ncbi:MAG TPA: HipA domain-containing protein [Steroidobacteraceae bacterium]|nr:HipA domain-containing protein [Steroidobacteraceae bacterium]
MAPGSVLSTSTNAQCADVPELFRRMIFNALISNRDDHPLNHAVIATDQDWKLSPAYDLTPSIVVSLERRDLAMVCGDRGHYAQVQALMQSTRIRLANRLVGRET